MNPIKAINEMAHTSERAWDGSIYTIEDCRYPLYNGRKILVTLEYGKTIARWIE